MNKKDYSSTARIYFKSVCLLYDDKIQRNNDPKKLHQLKLTQTRGTFNGKDSRKQAASKSHLKNCIQQALMKGFLSDLVPYRNKHNLKYIQ